MNNFRCQFYTGSIPTWESMLNECKLAKKSIHIEQYIFEEDIIGTQFVELLKEKSREGVKVKILVDMIGSINFYNSNTPAELKKYGIEVKFYNIVRPGHILNFTNLFLRDHRKITVVDGHVGFTGGVGIRDNMTYWRDTAGRLEGDVVQEMEDSFMEMWNRADDRGFVRKIRKFREQVRRINFITNDPYFNKRFLYYSLAEAFRNAKKSILITNPYFIPDRRFSRILSSAVKRGVEVKIIVPENMDVPLIESASNSTFESLLKVGVRIFRFQPNFLHAKTAVVDDEWSTFGSFNLDSLSFRYNHEANVVTFDNKCASDLKEIFYNDLKDSIEIKYIEWKKRSVIKKIKEFLAGLISAFL